MQPAAVLSILVTANAGPATRVLGRVNAQLGSTQSRASHATSALATLGKVTAVGVAGGMAYALNKAADFEQQMSSLGAVTSANDRTLARFRKQAMQAGADTKYSALQAAQAQTELAKGGLSVKNIMRGGLKSSLALAAAGELDLADAASTTVNAMKLFGLRGKDSMKVADALATAANATTADVSDFAMALKMGGSVARMAGADLNETVTVLEALAEAGIKNSDAGTSLKSFFLNIATPSNKAKDAMEELGMSIFDAEGNLKSLPALSENLRSSFGDLTKEQFLAKAGTIAGSDAIRTLYALYDAGPDKLRKLSKANDQQGSALDTAAKKQDNFRGKLENLQGSVETAAIAIGTKWLPELTRAAEQITDIINDKKLTPDEKFDRLAKIASHAFSGMVDDVAREAADAGPRIAGELGMSLASAWTDMNPLGKLFTAAAVIRLVGGRGALISTGGAIGKALGLGVASSTATSAATGAAGAGGVLGSMRGKLLPLAARAGLAGVGIALADQVISEFGRRAQAKSPDLLEALKGKAGPEDNPLNFLSRKLGLGRGTPGLVNASDTAKDMVPIFDQLNDKRALLSQAEVNDITSKAHQLDLTKQQRKEMQRTIDLLQQSRNLNIGVDLDMDPSKLRILDGGIQKLKAGVFTSMGDIAKVSQRNMRIVRQTIGMNTSEGRKAAAGNLRATAEAFQLQMLRSGNATKEGMDRVRRLIRRADLLSPTREKAREFGHEWARGMDRSKEITREGIRKLIAEAGKMPGPMRKVALQTWNAQITSAVKAGKITKDEARNMRSRVSAAFQGIELTSTRRSGKSADAVVRNTARMVNQSSKGFAILGDNANSALRAFGVKELKFEVKKFQAGDKKQTGGFIVPGTGSGDTHRTALPHGAFVLNREATKAFGLQRGGMMPVALEPGERVFMPNEVARVGHKTLATANEVVPRFQKGGDVGSGGHIIELLHPFNDPAGHGGSNSHLHIAMDNVSALIALGHQLQKLGWLVGENPAFGGIQGHHAETGYHPTGQAIDVNWPDAGQEGAKIKALLPMLNAMAGGAAGSLLGTMAPKLDRMVLDGANGTLKDLGQSALDKVRKAGNAYVEQSMPFEQGIEGGGNLTGNASANIALGRKMAARYGWVGAQFGALKTLWTGESGWDDTAINASSGAAGIPQDITGNLHGGAAGQIKWGLDYIKGRYGSPAAALAFWNAQSPHWYQKGGLVGYVGDSLGQGTLAAGLAGKLGKINLKANAAQGRSSAAGAGVLKDIYSKAMDAIVFDLGTNDDGAGQLAGSLGQVKKLIGSRPLVMSTMLGKDAAGKNKLVGRRADKVVDWAKVAGKYVGGDPQGIHPNAAGYGKRADMVAAAVKAVVGDGKGGNGVKSQSGMSWTPLKNAPGSKRARTLEGQIDETLRFSRHATKTFRSKKLKALMGRIKGIDLPKGLISNLAQYEKSANVAADFSNRAEQLNVDMVDAQGNPVLDAENRPMTQWAIVNGKTEAEWVQAQLDALFSWRNEILKAKKVVDRKRDYVAGLIANVQKQLRKVAEQIRKAAQRKAKLEREIEKGRDELDKLREHPKKNKSKIEALRGEIMGKVAEVKDIRPQQAERVRARKALTKILGDDSSGLVGRRAHFGKVRDDLAANLETVQGIGSPMDVLSVLPSIGTLGGDIFDAQIKLQGLGVKPAAVVDSSTDTSGGDSERASVLEELLRQSNLRTAVSERALGVFKDFPMYDQTGVPFMGKFATGGVALVGERGPELAHLPSGTRIHTAAETQQMLAPDLQVIVNGDIVGTPRGKEPIEALVGSQRFKVAIQREVASLSRQAKRGGI